MIDKLLKLSICIILFLIGLGYFVDVAPAASSHFKDTDSVVEYSLQGLRDSAQQMVNRNQWLKSQIIQMKDQLPALKQRLEILEGQKEKLELLSQDNYSSRVLKKYTSNHNLESSVMKTQYGFEQEIKDLERKIQLEEEKNQRFKEEKSSLDADIKQKEHELSLLKEEMKDQSLKTEWQTLVYQKEQRLKSLANARKTLNKLEMEHSKPQEQMRMLENEQKNLQNRIGQLENAMNISLNQENDIRQQILNIRAENIQKMAKLNQDMDQLKLKLKQIQDTLSKAQEKIQNKQIQLTSEGYSDKDLKQSIDLMTKENISLKEEMGMLSNKLNNVELLK